VNLEKESKISVLNSIVFHNTRAVDFGVVATAITVCDGPLRRCLTWYISHVCYVCGGGQFFTPILQHSFYIVFHRNDSEHFLCTLIFFGNCFWLNACRLSNPFWRRVLYSFRLISSVWCCLWVNSFRILEKKKYSRNFSNEIFVLM